MNIVTKLEEKVISGTKITYQEAQELAENADQNDLLNAADRIRIHFMENKMDLCTIMNAKSGKCSENCTYCPQSSHYNTGVKEYDLVSIEETLKLAKENESEGVNRFSLVTSGKFLKDTDLKDLVQMYDKLHQETNLKLCASHGFLTKEQAIKLKESGVTRYHHNLETSRNFYSKICTTHSYQDRFDTIKNAQAGGLEVCSGGIIGMGESMTDRIDMAFDLRELGIKSIPINILNPIKGTPLENVKAISVEECLRTIAVYRFIAPDAYIRYAGGRSSFGDKQVQGLHAGINAMLVGNYLTTIGNKIVDDIEMLTAEGFIIK